MLYKIHKTASIRQYCTRAQSFFLILFVFFFVFCKSWRDDWKRANSARNLTTGKVTLISKMFQMNLNCLEKYKQIHRQNTRQGQIWITKLSWFSTPVLPVATVDCNTGAGVFKIKPNPLHLVFFEASFNVLLRRLGVANASSALVLLSLWLPVKLDLQ